MYIATVGQHPVTIQIPKRLHPYAICVRRRFVAEQIPKDASTKMFHVECPAEFVDLIHDKDLHTYFMAHQTKDVPFHVLKTYMLTKERCNMAVSHNVEWTQIHPYSLVEMPIRNKTGLVFVEHVKPTVIEVTIADPLRIHDNPLFHDTLSELF